MVDGGLIGVVEVEVGVVVAAARLLDGGVFHQRTDAVVAGILEIHAIPASVAAFVGRQQDGIGLRAVEVHAGLPNVQTRVGHEHDGHARLDVVGARGEADIACHKVGAVGCCEVANPVEVAFQLGIASHGEGDVVNSEVIRARGRDAKHILDIALALVDNSGKVAARRGPVAVIHAFVRRAVKDFVSLRGGIGKGVAQVLQCLGRTYIIRYTDEGRLHDGFVGSGDGHVAHQTVDHARCGCAASEEELVAESEGCALCVALRQHDIGERPREVGIVQGSVVELVARYVAVVSAKDGEHAVGAKHGVVVGGFGQCLL